MLHLDYQKPLLLQAAMATSDGNVQKPQDHRDPELIETQFQSVTLEAKKQFQVVRKVISMA
jgi:hypothetical protein